MSRSYPQPDGPIDLHGYPVDRTCAIDLHGYQHKDYKNNFLFSLDGNPANAQWLSKRTAAFSGYTKQYQTPGIPYVRGEITIIYWAADRKGLLSMGKHIREIVQHFDDHRQKEVIDG